MKNVSKKFILLIILIFSGCSEFWPPETPKDEIDTVPWNKLSGRVVFSHGGSEMGRTYSTLYKMDVNKKSVETIYDLYGFFPEWSFDGKFLLVTENGQLNVTNFRDSFYTVSYPHSKISYGSWTATNMIAAVVTDSSLDSIYSIWIGNKPFIQNINGAITRPAFSHDGKYVIVCISKPSTIFGKYISPGIIKINLLDSSCVIIQSPNIQNEIYESPIFSFDDSKIAFIKSFQSYSINHELWVINNDGTNGRLLSSDLWDSNPAFSPQNDKIMFGHHWNLFLINVDGSGLTQLFKTGSGTPTWTK